MSEVEQLRVVVLDCFEEFLLRLVDVRADAPMAIRAIRATVFVDGVVADTQAVVLAGIGRSVFILHAHVSNEVERHLFKFFNRHSGDVFIGFLSISVIHSSVAEEIASPMSAFNGTILYVPSLYIACTMYLRSVLLL